MSHRANKARATTGRDVLAAVAATAPKEKTIYAQDSNGAHAAVTMPVRIRHKPIAWGIPFDEVVFSKWVINFLGLPIMPWDTLITSTSTYLPEARNIVHRDFLTTGLEWLVMLDSDVLPPPNFLEKLLAHKKKMVGGWYRKKGGEYLPVVYDHTGQVDADGKDVWKIRGVPGTGLEKVDGAGAGCWLMHRDVALAIGEKPYDMQRGGEDLVLCQKVHAAGFDTWIDWSVACAHAGVMYV